MERMTGTCGTERDMSRSSRVPTVEGTVLVEIADRVRRLLPSSRDPERFHVEKSEIEHELRRLAGKVR